ncbi:MAG: nitroreductase family deazaflavin-dependent oxidoreductase [Actinobacteria bacterium]|nr:nitroreductase family deazaflavin-dependent oxidoreductase [Actinomycetota bacterium]
MRAATAVDPILLKLSGGRVSLPLGLPTLLLRTTGARSGEPREAPLLYAPDGDRIVLIASQGGAPRNPAWYHNLVAHPECEVLATHERSGNYIARQAEGEERERLWRIAIAVYSGYDTYAARAGERRIPVMVLERTQA